MKNDYVWIFAYALIPLQWILFAQNDRLAERRVGRAPVQLRRVEAVLSECLDGLRVERWVGGVEHADVGGAAFGGDDAFDRDRAFDRGARREFDRGAISHGGHHEDVAFGELDLRPELVGRPRDVGRLVLQVARRGHGRCYGYEQRARLRRLFDAIRSLKFANPESAPGAAQHDGLVIPDGHAFRFEQNFVCVFRGEIDAYVALCDHARNDRETELAFVHRLRIGEALAFAQADGADEPELELLGAEAALDRVHLLFGRRSCLVEFVNLGELLRLRVVELVNGDGDADAVIGLFQK